MSALDLGLLALRVAIGVTFFAHGAQKILGWWEGPGFEKWTAGIARRGLRPARLWSAIAAGNEFVCGPLLAIGLLTPVAAALLVAQSLYIVLRVHLAKGFWVGKGGVEFALQLLAGSLLLTASGPGAISLDAPLALTFSPELRVAIFVVALAGVLVAFVLPRLLGSAPEQPRAA